MMNINQYKWYAWKNNFCIVLLKKNKQSNKKYIKKLNNYINFSKALKKIEVKEEDFSKSDKESTCSFQTSSEFAEPLSISKIEIEQFQKVKYTILHSIYHVVVFIFF